VRELWLNHGKIHRKVELAGETIDREFPCGPALDRVPRNLQQGRHPELRVAASGFGSKAVTFHLGVVFAGRPEADAPQPSPD
jgi:hypothetical protein